MAMALTKAEYKRRLDAALALTGMKRTELPDLLEQRGIKRHSARRAGHPSDDYTPNEALAIALGKILGVGQAWFEEPDVSRLIDGATAPSASAIDDEAREAEEDLRRRGAGEDRPEPGEGRAADA